MDDGTMNLERLIDYWETAAERSEGLARTVSGEGEAAEIYRKTAGFLKDLKALYGNRPVAVGLE